MWALGIQFNENLVIKVFLLIAKDWEYLLGALEHLFHLVF